jgi:hypothetical protein
LCYDDLECSTLVSVRRGTADVLSQRRNTTKPNVAFHNQLRSESKIEIISLCTITKILLYSLTVPGQQQDKVFERFRIRYSFMIHLSKQKPVDSLVTPIINLSADYQPYPYYDNVVRTHIYFLLEI